MNIKNKSYDMILAYLFLIVLAGELVYELYIGDYENIPNVFLTVVTTIVTTYILKKSRLKVGGTLLHGITIIFIFLSMYIGKIRNAYFIFPNWDKFLHLSSGVITTLLALAIIYKVSKKDIQKIIGVKGIIIFLIIFSISAAGVWEIYEYATDFLLGLNSQRGSLDDTMQDMICATIVTLITCVPLYLGMKNKTEVIDKIMQ